MSADTIPQTVLFPDLFDRPLVAPFDQAHASSDGGAMLLKAADARLGLTAALAACLTDGRASGRIAHTLHELLAQRIFASRAAARMPRMLIGWPTIRSRSCCSTAIRSTPRRWRRS